MKTAMPGSPRPVRWVIGGVHTETQPTFFVLLGVFFLMEVGRVPLWQALAFPVVVWGSVLLHEFGHAIVARLFGQEVLGIRLHGFGGATYHRGKLSPLGRVCISLAGPMAGFVASAPLWFVPVSESSPVVTALVGQLLWVNVGWGLINLFPALPLDGGQVVQGLLSFFMSPARARRAAGYLGAVAGLGVVGVSMWLGASSFLMLMGGYCAYISYQSAQA